MVTTDSAAPVRNPRKHQGREFLTLEELQAAANVPCEMPILKSAFIFSALTGLRWSDIEKLVWSEVQHSEQSGYYIRFRQKKNGCFVPNNWSWSVRINPR